MLGFFSRSHTTGSLFTFLVGIDQSIISKEGHVFAFSKPAQSGRLHNHGQHFYGRSMCWAVQEQHQQMAKSEQLELSGLQTAFAFFASQLRCFGHAKVVSDGKLIHGQITATGLDKNARLQNLVLQMYCSCRALEDARALFNKICIRDVYSWNIMIKAYGRDGQRKEALYFFEQMQAEGELPDRFIFVSVLSTLASEEAIAIGDQLHARIFGAKYMADVVVGTGVANMYVKCGRPDCGRRVFDEMPERDAVAWTALISSYAENDELSNALKLFDRMECEGVMPNKFTLVSILNVCTKHMALVKGKQVHVRSVYDGLETYVVTGNALVAMYGRCGKLNEAQRIFNEILERDTISWTAMIACNAEKGQLKMSLRLFHQMQIEGVAPDTITLISVLSALCNHAALLEGKRLHACIAASVFLRDAAVGNALLTMYGKCGNLKDAQLMFDNLLTRNVTSWTAMIAMLAQNGRGKDALLTFERMQQEGGTPNEFTFVSSLNACACQLAFLKGKQIHAQLIGCVCKGNVVGDTALLNMYGKCGSLKDAQSVFDQIEERDLIVWNAMIATCAQHNKDAIQLFEQMQMEGVIPNRVTFVSILAACSHAGLIHDGCDSFLSMNQQHGIQPARDHFNCMIDLLGKAGKVDEAEALLKEMPCRPAVESLMAVLDACRTQIDVDRGERIAKQIFKLNPKEAGPYVMLSNMYFALNREEEDVCLHTMPKDISRKGCFLPSS